MAEHAPSRIDKVERRPVVIAEPAPNRAVVVDGDRVRDASLVGGPSNIVDVFLEREFGGVHTDDDQPLFLVRSQLMQVYVQKSTRTTLPCRSTAVSGSELSQAVAPPSEAKSLALDGLNGFAVSISLTEPLVPIHAAPRESAAIPKKRRR